MTWAILAFISHLVFIPGLYDGFSLPKRPYVFGLGIAAIIFLLNRTKRPLPLTTPIYFYLGVSIIPFFWVSNIPVFIERIALDAACFAVFWAVALSYPDRYKTQLAIVFGIAIAIVVLAAQHFFPLHNGTMGNPGYVAFVSSQAAPLALLSTGAVSVFAAASLWLLSEASHAAFAAAIISLVVFGVTRKVFSARYFFYVAVAVVILSPVIVHYDLINLSGVRKATWQNSIYMLEKPYHLIFGIGRGQFEIQYPAFANRKAMDTQQDAGAASERKVVLAWGHPHNEFLNSLIETGLIGAVLFWWIIVMLAEKTWSNDRTALAISCSLLGTVLFSTFWFPFTHPSMAVTFWALAGLLWGYRPDDL